MLIHELNLIDLFNNSRRGASTIYTLGASAGANTAKAELTANSALNANFTATGTAGTPTQIAITGGNSQSAGLGAALSSALSVNVKDANNNNVNAATINWAASSGTLGSGASTTTNSSGNTSNTLTIGTGATAAGAKTVTATINGTSTLVTFNVTATVATPTGLAGTNAAAASSLSWTATTGATSYKIYRSTTSGSGYTLVNTSVTNSYSDSGLTNGTAYYYVVSALNNSVESSQSAQTSVTPVVAPGVPTTLVGTLASTQTVLTWTAPSTGTGPFTYKVYRSTTSGSGYTNIATTGSGVVTYTNTGLTNGTTYYYVVTALNGSVSGESSYSSEIAITPDYIPTLAYDFTNASSFQPHNLITYSEDLSSSTGGWTATGIDVVTNAVLSPTGTPTADFLRESSGGSVHTIHKSLTKAANAIEYTASAYMKPVGGRWGRIDLWDNGSLGTRVWFNLSGSGAVGTRLNIGSGFTNVRTSIFAVGNGWYRVSLTATSSTTTAISTYIYPATGDTNASYSGDGASGIYVWGVQLEQNPGVSRYVATTTVASTSFSSPLSPTYGSTALTFTRADAATAATVYGSDGKLRRAPHNYFTNSLGFTDFNYRNLLSSNNAAPDGTNTAVINVFDQASGSRFFAQLTGNGNTTYSGSVWAKAISGSSVTAIDLHVQDINSDATRGSSGSVTLSTTQWTRITATGKTLGSTGSPGLRFTIYNQGVTGSGATVLLWGPQVEENLSPSSYLATTSAARFDSPRFDYDPVTLAPKGGLLEGSRINSLTYSEQFDDAAWSKSNATISANLTTAPDGTTTADKIVENTANSTHLAAEYFSITAGTTLTASVFLKPAERTSIYVGLSGASLFPSSLNPYLIVNTSSCTITSSINVSNSSIQNVGNGWCRVTLTQTPTSSGGSGLNLLLISGGSSSYLGDGSSGAYVWGAQLEAAANASSYIPSAASSVSRSPEYLYASGASGVIAATGTVLTEAAFGKPYLDNGNYYSPLVVLSDTSHNNRYDFDLPGTTSSYSRLTVRAGGSAQLDQTPNAISANTFYKTGFTYSAGAASMTLSGSTLDYTLSSSPTGLNLIDIGCRSYAGNTFGGWIKNFKYQNTVLPNVDMNRLTQ